MPKSKSVFAEVKSKWGRLDVLFNNAGMGAPAVPMEDLPIEKWREVVDINLTGDVPVHAGSVPHHEGAGPAGRPHHQQRLDLGARAAADVGRLHRHQARGHRPHQVHLARRPQVRHRRGQIDIGNALTEMAARMASGVPQADGTIKPEPLMDVKHVGDAVLHMANLPLDANVQFMTIMATKMPFVGRG